MKQRECFGFALVLFTVLVLLNVCTYGQAPVSCPENIGFELGTFKNWEAFSGKINASGEITVSSSPPQPTRHTILQNTYPQQKDPFGDFPVNCPNGSGYSIMLGNSATGSEAEQLSYTFTIPSNQNQYSIIYNYAVVLQNPSHQDYQQPKFTSKVFDVTSGQYIDCGSFEFVASSNLPGFQLSKVGTNIYYKPWSPITINLYGYAGKTIRIEFSNNDCTLGGHFGYAYLDVNENCSSPISGNVYCNGANSVSLTAPYGFREYRWYTADFSQLLGNDNILKISPPPPPNSEYALEIVPYPGLGCLDTLSSVIKLSSDAFKLNVVDSIAACINTGADLTATSITPGSTPGLSFSYFMDANQREYLPTPKVVTESGVYFIKAANAAGCNEIKPIKTAIKPPPKITVTSPAAACTPNTVDLTHLSVTTGSDPGLSFTYWKDAGTTNGLLNPKTVNASGTYYIKGSAVAGCATTVPVSATVSSVPAVSIANPSGCGQVDLSEPFMTAGSERGLTFSYWKDSAASLNVPPSNIVTSSGTYYVKGTNVLGCSTVKPVEVSINPFPVFTVPDPITVTYPATADLTSAVSPRGVLKYTYWRDKQATVPLPRPNSLGFNGTYFINAKNEFNCAVTQPVTVIINAPPDPKIIAPTAFSPNNDGINDLFKLTIVGEVDVNNVKIYNRWGQVVFDTKTIANKWDGNMNGSPLPTGVYYWVLEGLDKYKEKKMVNSGSITLIR